MNKTPTPAWQKNLVRNAHMLPVDISAAVLQEKDQPDAPPTLSEGDLIRKTAKIKGELDPNTFFFILVGIIDGALLEALARELPGQITVVEPDIERIRQALARRVLDVPRGKVLVVDEYQRIPGSWIGMFTAQNITVIPTKEAWDRFPDVVNNCRNIAMYSQQTSASNWSTITKKSIEWTKNSVLNILADLPMEHLRSQPWADSPALCIAAGPSLPQSLDLAKQWKGPIFCVGHALRPVMAAGITPDFCVYTEGLDAVAFFEGLDLSQIRLVCTYTIGHGVFSLGWKSRVVFSGTNTIELLAWWKFGGTENIHTGPSCANTAARAAWAMGCRTICLIGQDLAYNATEYAEGADWNKKIKYVVEEPPEGQKMNHLRGKIYVGEPDDPRYRVEPGTLWPHKNGEEKMVITSIAFTLFMGDFLKFAQEHWHDGAFVDFTPDGAMIHSWAWAGGDPGEYLDNMTFEPYQYTSAPLTLDHGREHIETAKDCALTMWRKLNKKLPCDLADILEHPILVGLILRDFDKDPKINTLKGSLMASYSWIKKQLK